MAKGPKERSVKANSAKGPSTALQRGTGRSYEGPRPDHEIFQKTISLFIGTGVGRDVPAVGGMT